MSFKDNINKLRHQYKVTIQKEGGREYIRCISQSELASEMDVNQAIISYYESGDRIPSYENIVKLCKILKCTPNDLMEGDYE